MYIGVGSSRVDKSEERGVGRQSTKEREREKKNLCYYHNSSLVGLAPFIHRLSVFLASGNIVNIIFA